MRFSFLGETWFQRGFARASGTNPPDRPLAPSRAPHRAPTAAAPLLAALALAGCGGAGDVDSVPAAGSADLRVSTVVSADRIVEGGVATYVMTATNAGPGEARDVALAVTLDGAPALGAMTCAASGGAICPAHLGAAMTVASLPTGGGLTFTLPATVPATGKRRSVVGGLTARAAGDRHTASGWVTAIAVPLNWIRLQSDPGDYIGLGGSYSYTGVDAKLTFDASGNRLSVTVTGDQRWSGDFQLPNTVSRWQPGRYENLTRYLFQNAATGALSWYGEGRGCNALTGSITVTRANYVGDVLDELDFSFEQHCEAAAPALRGQIQWSRLDAAKPPGPIDPPPPGLWVPPASATPTTGNYVYLQSDAGDYIGAGGSYLYTQRDSILSVTATDNWLTLTVNGDERWWGDFKAMDGVPRLKTGYYPGLRRFPFNNPARGGLNWSGEGRGCNLLSGWFVVDSVSYDSEGLSSIELRFEQHCESRVPALRGKIRWSRFDTTQPPGPINPPPSGLWAPPDGATPTSGSYVYLQSDAGDYIGGGRGYLYSLRNSELRVSAFGNSFSIQVNGDEQWFGSFGAMVNLTRLEAGYYPGLRRFPFNNPTRGGLNWDGEGRGCNQLQGWFVIDSVAYDSEGLSSIELRFEQHCEGAGPALHGKIKWSRFDTTQPPGPINPPPAGLWAPADGTTPASGNYVYLKSDAGDYVGAGATYLYVQSGNNIKFTAMDNVLSVQVSGAEWWFGDFQTMNSLSRFALGYYGDLRRYPFHNPAKGGLDWFGQGRGCNELTGWFVVDSFSYDSAGLSAIELRFEQHCEGAAPALRGKIRWSR